MSAQERKEVREQQRKDQYHSQNLQGQSQQRGEAAQVLHALSEIDDVPVDQDEEEIIGQVFSKVSSTTNLSEEEVRSMEWLHELLIPLYISTFPTEDGCHGVWRGWQHADENKEREPLSQKKRMKIEAENITGKKVTARSKDGFVVKEGTRDVNESVITEPDSGSGGNGLLGRLR